MKSTNGRGTNRRASGAPGADKTRTSEARIQRDIHAYKRSMAGLSVRAICDEMGLKSTQTAFAAINRGREFAKARGIDAEETRIKIQELFDETIGLLMATAKTQHVEGAVTEFVDADGNVSIKRIKGIDPRVAGELSRSLNRWAEFCGLLDRAPEQNVQATTVVLAAPPAGATFDAQYDKPLLEASAGHQVVDAAATPAGRVVVCEEGGPGWGAGPDEVD